MKSIKLSSKASLDQATIDRAFGIATTLLDARDAAAAEAKKEGEKPAAAAAAEALTLLTRERQILEERAKIRSYARNSLSRIAESSDVAPQPIPSTQPQNLPAGAISSSGLSTLEAGTTTIDDQVTFEVELECYRQLHAATEAVADAMSISTPTPRNHTSFSRRGASKRIGLRDTVELLRALWGNRRSSL